MHDYTNSPVNDEFFFSAVFILRRSFELSKVHNRSLAHTKNISQFLFDFRLSYRIFVLLPPLIGLYLIKIFLFHQILFDSNWIYHKILIYFLWDSNTHSHLTKLKKTNDSILCCSVLHQENKLHAVSLDSPCCLRIFVLVCGCLKLSWWYEGGKFLDLKLWMKIFKI